jgi:hypothetical protein
MAIFSVVFHLLLILPLGFSQFRKQKKASHLALADQTLAFLFLWWINYFFGKVTTIPSRLAFRMIALTCFPVIVSSSLKDWFSVLLRPSNSVLHPCGIGRRTWFPFGRFVGMLDLVVIEPDQCPRRPFIGIRDAISTEPLLVVPPAQFALRMPLAAGVTGELLGTGGDFFRGRFPVRVNYPDRVVKVPDHKSLSDRPVVFTPDYFDHRRFPETKTGGPFGSPVLLSIA